MEEIKKTLLRKVLKRFPGKIIQFVSDKTNWDDCFTIIDIDGTKKLTLWYNIENGTYSEAISL